MEKSYALDMSPMHIGLVIPHVMDPEEVGSGEFTLRQGKEIFSVRLERGYFDGSRIVTKMTLSGYRAGMEHAAAREISKRLGEHVDILREY